MLMDSFSEGVPERRAQAAQTRHHAILSPFPSPSPTGFLRRTVMTGLIMVYGQLIIILWYINKQRDGSFVE